MTLWEFYHSAQTPQHLLEFQCVHTRPPHVQQVVSCVLCCYCRSLFFYNIQELVFKGCLETLTNLTPMRKVTTQKKKSRDFMKGCWYALRVLHCKNKISQCCEGIIATNKEYWSLSQSTCGNVLSAVSYIARPAAEHGLSFSSSSTNKGYFTCTQGPSMRGLGLKRLGIWCTTLW